MASRVSPRTPSSMASRSTPATSPMLSTRRSSRESRRSSRIPVARRIPVIISQPHPPSSTSGSPLSIARYGSSNIAGQAGEQSHLANSRTPPKTLSSKIPQPRMPQMDFKWGNFKRPANDGDVTAFTVLRPRLRELAIRMYGDKVELKKRGSETAPVGSNNDNKTSPDGQRGLIPKARAEPAPPLPTMASVVGDIRYGRIANTSYILIYLNVEPAGAEGPASDEFLALNARFFDVLKNELFYETMDKCLMGGHLIDVMAEGCFEGKDPEAKIGSIVDLFEVQVNHPISGRLLVGPMDRQEAWMKSM